MYIKKENSGLLLDLNHSIKAKNKLNVISLKFPTLPNTNANNKFKQVLQRVLKEVEKDSYDTFSIINTNNFEFGN